MQYSLIYMCIIIKEKTKILKKCFIYPHSQQNTLQEVSSGFTNRELVHRLMLDSLG